MALQHFKAKLFSGLHHFSSYHFGGITVEIEIKPSGGGAVWLPHPPVYIRVTVKHKNRIWTVQKEHSYLAALSLTAVKATFIKYETIKAIVIARFNRINNIIESIITKATKK